MGFDAPEWCCLCARFYGAVWRPAEIRLLTADVSLCLLLCAALGECTEAFCGSQ